MKEIETAFRVDTRQLPDLNLVRYVDIEQDYLSPHPAAADYPEIAVGEWRVRRKQSDDGKTSYSSTVKYGDKQSGQRIEVETALEPGDFGTRSEDIARYSYGSIRKRRYFMPDEVVLDQFEPNTHGHLWLAEREFSGLEEQGSWQPPSWAIADQAIPNNRLLAQPPKTTQRTQAYPGNELSSIREDIMMKHIEDGPVLVTVSGMSGSGKTTVARQLAKELSATLISTDNFHIGKTAFEARYGEINHDLPHTYDYSAAAQAAGRLLTGSEVEIPRYDFATAERLATPEIVPAPDRSIVILEGLYAWRAARAATPRQPNYNILLDTPLHVCVLRRILRDAALESDQQEAERTLSWTAEESLRYLMHVAIPTYLAHAPAPERFNGVVR